MTELAKVLELNETKTTWADRTYRSERGVRRFLATLTPAQMAEAEVLVDDDCYVVFYPVAAVAGQVGAEGGFHFDLETNHFAPSTNQSYKPAQADQLKREQAVLAAAALPESNLANAGLKREMLGKIEGATHSQFEQEAELPGLLTSVRV